MLYYYSYNLDNIPGKGAKNMSEKKDNEKSIKERMKEDPEFRKKVRDAVIKKAIEKNYEALKRLSKE